MFRRYIDYVGQQITDSAIFRSKGCRIHFCLYNLKAYVAGVGVLLKLQHVKIFLDLTLTVCRASCCHRNFSEKLQVLVQLPTWREKISKEY